LHARNLRGATWLRMDLCLKKIAAEAIGQALSENI